MTIRHETARNTFTEDFLRLPRELRDLIYAEVYGDSTPVHLEDVQMGPAGMALSAAGEHTIDADFAAEILESFYTHSTFVVSFPYHESGAEIHPIKWGPHPQYRRYIRRLIVQAHEADIRLVTSLRLDTSLKHLEDQCSDAAGLAHYSRTDWEHLLALPRLEHLSIRFQKHQHSRLTWVDFSPILIELRQKLPKLLLEFSISFDTILECYWSDPIWENYTEPGNVVEEPYDPMGFVDISELFEAPTEKEVAYVQAMFSGQLGTMGRDILRGLLDETASQRRALASHYVVKEPALLRVRMMEHYEVYKSVKSRVEHSL